MDGRHMRTKSFLQFAAILFSGILSVTSAAAATNDVRINVMITGKEIALPPDRRSTLVSNVVSFVHSASVNLTQWSANQEAGEKEWERLMKSDSFIHITFTKPATISLMRADNQGREEKTVSQILVTLPVNRWPWVCVKSDGAVIGLTKYNPLALKVLVAEPALGLSSVPPYDSLIKHAEKRQGRQTESRQTGDR